MKINPKKNLFTSTRLKLDIIAAIFVFFILFSFSYVVYSLLTQDIIYQISPIFKNSEIANYINSDLLFKDFRNQTFFLLFVSDIIIFCISMVFFDRLVRRMLKPIEYVSELQKRFASNVSHELRTPLSIMNMRGEILMSKIEKEEIKNEKENKFINTKLDNKSDKKFLFETKDGVNVILKEISGITGLLDDLLFEARIKFSENKIEDVSLEKIIKILQKSFNNLSHLKNEKVNYIFVNNLSLEDEKKYIKVNPINLERIFNNLISNSFKFTKNGEIKITLNKYKKQKREYLKFIIEDTGIGINKKDLPKISERFYRGKNVENEVAGTGIGLSIVKDIIKDNNWNFKIKSEENVGTIIEITKILFF